MTRTARRALFMGEAGLSRLLFMTILLLSAACATAGTPRSASSVVIQGIPFYPQEAHQCGPSSLAAVLNYRGVAATPEEVAADIYSSSARGTLGIDMLLYAQRRGLRAHQYRGSFDDLRLNIDSGNPVIVLVDYGLWAYQRAHFMVVVGYSEEGFLANSGREHLKFIPRQELSKVWEKTGFWSLTIGQ